MNVVKYLRKLRDAPRVSVINFRGVIARGTNRRNEVNFARYKPALDRAFKGRNTKAVALSIDSPGGAACESSLIYKHIVRLKEKHKIPVIAFAENMCTSGGYYIASAADEIIADESSVVGSIGVLYAGLGFNELIDKIGVDRRVYTAGTSKLTLDPFAPTKSRDVEKIQRLLNEIHKTFISVVKESRGDRLQYDVAKALAQEVSSTTDPKEDGLFDGSIYTGELAVQTGLVDSIGYLHSEMEKRFGEEVMYRVFQPRGFSLFGLGQISANVGAEIGSQAAKSLLSEMEDARMRATIKV